MTAVAGGDEPLLARGWFRPYLHLVDSRYPRTLLLADPFGVHGMSGELVWFAVCTLPIHPAEPASAHPAWPYCPVCWAHPGGHRFEWVFAPCSCRARCVRTGCGRYDTDVRDPGTGFYLPCAGGGEPYQS